MVVVIKGFDFGEDGEFSSFAATRVFVPLREELTKIAKNISKLSSVDGSGVKEAIEEIKKLQNGVEILRAVAQGTSMFALEYEVKYTDLEVFNANKIGF